MRVTQTHRTLGVTLRSNFRLLTLSSPGFGDHREAQQVATLEIDAEMRPPGTGRDRKRYELRQQLHLRHRI